MVQRSNRDILFISSLALLWALQAAVMVAEVLGFWHFPILLKDSLLPETIGQMLPKWDLLIEFVFMAVALISGKLLYQYYLKPANYGLLGVEAVITFLMLSAVFKILVYFNSPQLAQGALLVLIILSILSKIFHDELKKALFISVQWVKFKNLEPLANLGWMVVIVLMTYMPKLENVIAMIYMGDWLHHFDYMIMSVGLASLHGQIPYVDVISQYGVGVPIIFAKLTALWGKFDYVDVLATMMWFVIIYFIMTYFFVRYWLKSAFMGGIAFLLIFRLQMFHYGVSPLVWCTPSASPVRFGLDILWMAAIVAHLRTGRSKWLILAAIYSGFAPYYMTSGGICIMMTFYIYLLALMIIPSLRNQLLNHHLKRRICILCFVLPILSALIFFGMTIKGYLLSLEFWQHLIEYMKYFSLRGSMPMYESLKYRHYWAFIMSMVMPITYLSTLLYVGCGLYLEKLKKEWVFIGLLCINGLANYQYYVVRSAITSYYVDVLPFILIACWWLMQVLEILPGIWQQRLKIAAVTLSFYALLTNQNYLAYPNLLNFSRNPLTDNLVIQRFPDRQGYFNNMYKNAKETDKIATNDLGTTQEEVRTEDDFKTDQDMVDYYHGHFNFQTDASLIKKLTKPQERVALISSFETEILIQAGRAPFFYHFPLLTSRPMTFRNFPSDAAHVPSFEEDTIKAINLYRPRYVLMEKVFLENTYPASYQENNGRVLAIISDVKKYYMPFEEGQFLVAMKRKDN